MPTRIYLLESQDGSVQLIEASTPSQARSYVARQQYQVSVADAKTIAQLFTTGKATKVERAVGEDDPS